MYGAIFGDIIGSRFEFDRGGKTKEFKLFTTADDFTDDTVMTVAVADGLLQAGKEATLAEIRESVTRTMRTWGRKYPGAGYGGRFNNWLFEARNPKPYGSYGNGSAMRVSAAGWLYDSLERTREVARATADVTHNHPEGIAGAECTAAVMYLARTGHSKEEIRAYVTREFNYDISKSLEQLRARHEHVETCQDSLPKALVSFFEGESYEDVVRSAVSLGGDTDTLAAIAGAMAEAFYGIPIAILAEGNAYLPEDIREVIKAFNAAIGRGGGDEKTDNYADNRLIKMAVSAVYKNSSREALLMLLDVLLERMLACGVAPTPMVDVNGAMDAFDFNAIKVGDRVTIDREMRLVFDTMTDGKGGRWFPLFTDEEELNKGLTTNVRVNVAIESVLASGLASERVNGVVINPFGESLTLNKEILKVMMDHYKGVVEEKK